MTETLHPGVYVKEEGLPPSITGSSTSTAGFVGRARRGPTDELVLVDSFKEYQRRFGKNYTNGYLEDSVYLFFENGGSRAYIGRVVGTGSAKATVNLPAIGTAASAARIDGTLAETFDLEPAETLEISVDGGGAQIFTVTATRAIETGAGIAIVGLDTDTLVVAIDGGANQTITFGATDTTLAAVINTVNSNLVGGRANDVGSELSIESDTRGSGSSVEIVSGTALTELGLTAGTTSGSGNVVTVDAVTAAEMVTMAAGLTGAALSANAGALRLDHLTAGVASTIEVTAAPAALGFPAGVVTGAATAQVDIFTVDATEVGVWGDAVSVSTLRWGTTITAGLATAGTSIALANIDKVVIGDIVEITDGTTATTVYVTSVNVSTKTIGFRAVTLGSTIASGATAKCASAHKASTSLSEAGAAVDTKIKVRSSSLIRVGTELSMDDGTTLVFRTVTLVNGTELTLNAALGAAFAADTPVISQHFHLSVVVDNEFDKSHTFLSLKETDTQDYAEVRLFGDANESLNIEITDLDPTIASAIEDRPAAVENILLAGGAEGATPVDNDYLGSVSPLSGLELFGERALGEINIIAIPGVTSTVVQQSLSDFAERSTRQDMIALIDAPVTLEEPTEIRDWRLNQHNRGTSYSALYYPWLVIRDRTSRSSDAERIVPPSGIMAGVYARVSSEVGVWEAPANRALLQVIRPLVKVTNGQQDILNPIGVNVIRAFPGEGTRPWGARTLSNVQDGRQYVHIRRLLNFVKSSVAVSLRPYTFAGIQQSLFSDVFSVIRSFYKTIWLQGGLFPEDDFESAQFVKVDSENNPADTRRLGQLNIDSGIQPPFIAEFIIFKVGLFDGVATVDEA